MVHAARALGLGVMVGCMVESSLGIAPSCPVASLCDHVDLDGNVLLAEDPWQGVELVDGVQVPVRAARARRDPRASSLAVKRYLVLAEGHSADPHHGKTMAGVVRYAPDPVVAILDSERAGETYEGIPIVARVSDALRFAPDDGDRRRRADRGRPAPRLARPAASVDLAGSRRRVGDARRSWRTIRSSPSTRRRHNVELRDLRRPPEGLGVPDRSEPSPGATVVHTVGSDCAIGKKTMALELDLEARRRGLDSVFVPTGQTGIAIAGWGIAVDSVVSDFVAGAAERLVVEGASRGDLLWVEGQGR